MKNILRRTYFWVYGKTNMGKPVVMGPYTEQLRADGVSEKLEDSRIFPLQTRNMQKATRSIKAILVQSSDTKNIDGHVRPHQHQMEGERLPFESKNSLASEILESSD